MQKNLQETTKGISLNELASNKNLTSAFTHGGSWLPSKNIGSKMIDHILTKNIDPQTFRRSGQLPHGLGFDSDHRAMFMDIDAETMLSLAPPEPVTNEPRLLVSGNRVNRDT